MHVGTQDGIRKEIKNSVGPSPGRGCSLFLLSPPITIQKGSSLRSLHFLSGLLTNTAQTVPHATKLYVISVILHVFRNLSPFLSVFHVVRAHCAQKS